jgi:hypothetical protein
MKNNRPAANGQGARTSGNRPQGKAGAKPKPGNGNGKVEAAKKKPSAASMRLSGVLLIAAAALVLGAGGLALLDRVTALLLAPGRSNVAADAIASAFALTGAITGLFLSLLIAANRKLVPALLLVLFLVGGLGAAGYFGGLSIADSIGSISSVEQRRSAVRSEFMLEAVASGALQAEALPSDPTRLDTAVFYAGVSLLSLPDPELHERLKANTEQIADLIISRSMTPDLAWSQYQAAIAQAERDYERYQLASANFAQAISQVQQRAQGLWQAVIEAARTRWVDHQRRRDAALKSLEARIPEMRDILSVYFQAKIRGDKIDEYERRYESLSREMFGAVIDYQTWCGTTGCPGNEQFLLAKGAEVLSEKFSERFGGVPLDVTEPAFLANPVVLSELRQEVAKQGVSLPADWRLDQGGMNTLISAAIRDLPTEARRVYNTTMTDVFGSAIEPNLSFGEFASREGMQRSLRDAVNLTPGTAVPIGLDREAFLSTLFPRIKRQPIELLARGVKAESEVFANGGQQYDAGLKAMLAVLGLPLAMTMAALAGVFGLVSGTAMLALLFWRATARLLRLDAGAAGRLSSMIWGGWLAILAMAFVLPFVVSAGPSSFARYGEVIGPAAARALPLGFLTDWAMRLAPGLKPLASEAHGMFFKDSDMGLTPGMGAVDDFGFVYEEHPETPELAPGSAGISGLKQRLDGMVEGDKKADEAAK